MIAKNIMTRDIITVTPTMTVKNLAMTLIKNQISGARCPARTARSWASSQNPISSARRVKTSRRS